MTEYETKDSGTHLEYDSGMRRDSQDGKPRFDLIRTKRQPYEEQMIYRYAMLLARGAEKYSARNWEEGCGEEELDRAKASLLRHTEQLIAGETDEDHAAAVWFNTQAIEYFRWRLSRKKRNGSAKRRRKARAKAEQARVDVDVNNLALQKAARMRARERMHEAAKDFDWSDMPALEVKAKAIPKETVELAWGGELPPSPSQRGAQGLFQFVDAPWPTFRPTPMPKLPTYDFDTTEFVKAIRDITKLYRTPKYYLPDYGPNPFQEKENSTSTEVDQTHPYE